MRLYRPKYTHGMCSLTTTEINGQCVVVPETNNNIIQNADTYSPSFLRSHPDLMVTGKAFDITSNETAEDIISQAFENNEINNLLNSNENG